MEEKVILINGKEMNAILISLKTDSIKRSPSFEDIFGDDEDAFEEFADRSDSEYICDAITEIADKMCGDPWNKVSENREYIEEAIFQGIVDTNHFDLERCLLAGQYEYYTTALYDNLDDLCVNYMVEHLNGIKICLIYLGDEYFDVEEINKLIIEELEELMGDYNGDNNDRFWDLNDSADEMLDEAFENLQDNYEGLVIAIEENFEDTLQEYIDERKDEE